MQTVSKRTINQKSKYWRQSFGRNSHTQRLARKSNNTRSPQLKEHSALQIYDSGQSNQKIISDLL